MLKSSWLLTYMETDDLICRQIDIRELADSDEPKVIVVDGNLFIKCHIRRKFQWVFDGILEFVENIRDTVKAFQNLNIKLVFFFDEIFDYESIENYGNYVWQRRRRLFVQRSRRIFLTLQMWPLMLQQLRNDKDALDVTRKQIPLDLICLTTAALRETDCDVISVQNDRIWRIASYARANDCLAVLSENPIFMFFENFKPLFLSLRRLDLRLLITKAYDRDLFDKHFKISKKLYPVLAALSNTSRSNLRNPLFRETISRGVSDSTHPNLSSMMFAYVRENFDDVSLEDIPNSLAEHFPMASRDLLKYYSKFKEMFNSELECSETRDESPLNLWEKTKMKCRELFTCGSICVKVYCIVYKQMFLQTPCIENFVEFPPSSVLYRRLRKAMYAILLHDAIGFVEDLAVKEWCIEGENSPECPVLVSPSPLDSALHPGLLAMWDSSIADPVHIEKKWRLFSAAVSPTLNFRSLRYLPKSMVIPVAVLCYLFREVPYFARNNINASLQPWEVEVFLVVALTLQYTDKDFLRNISFLQRPRVISLLSLYVNGCDTVKMVAESCGLILGEQYSSIWEFFDGKYFQYLFERRQVGAVILDSTSERFIEFQALCCIIFSQ